MGLLSSVVFLLIFVFDKNCGEVCDNGRVFPSITTQYEPEKSHRICMDTEIAYATPIPNSGMHRPKWARYGEYVYCPPQRWVHNLEHGGVVFLYHPCVHPKLKKALSHGARSCIYKHIITPHMNLSTERPLALVTWGSTLEMSHIDLYEVKNWLMANMGRTREQEMKIDGLYQHLLIQPASGVFDDHNKNICPRVCCKQVKSGLKRRRRDPASLGSALILTSTPIYSAEIMNSTAVSVEQPALDANESQPVIAHTVLGTALSSSESDVKVHVTLMPSNVSREKDALVDPGGRHYMESNASGVLPLQKEPTFLDTSKGSSPVQSKNTSKEPGGSQVVPSLTVTQKESGASRTHNKSISEKTTLEGQDPATTTKQKQNTAEFPVGLLPATAPKPTAEPPVGPISTTDTKPTPGTPVGPISTTIAPKPTAEPPVGPISTTASKPTAAIIEGKQECNCKHEPTKEASAAAQKASGLEQMKASDVFISTPRTEEAAWAAACLTFLFVLLTLSVLYTQIYKRFRKSQSLYWPSEGIATETETVASVIKRRLMSGHSKRKKWIKHKKTPVLLYESLSESSE
uniref:Tumor protein p53 inducible protein 13 n=1 Tax=Xenopus tropicalis TaxID=8364 RepID=A0A6I8SQN1_XENTR|eukprot:XP_017946553.1 PREDICTED: tumor protein p53-inducible protein 13 isoform X1 [Xenopus tropicalis]